MALKPLTPTLTDPGTPPWRSPGPLQKASALTEFHRTSPRSFFPLSMPEQPSHQAPPPLDSAPPSLGRYSAARAPVRPEPSSPCSSPPFAPPPASFGAPEKSEAKLWGARHRALCPCHRESTVDSWTGHPGAGPRAMDRVHCISY
jgi:hypothetical protein